MQEKFSATDRERLWGRTDRSTGCWRWLGSRTLMGYGSFSYYPEPRNCRTVSAHRASWVMAYGDIPLGMVVRHKCDVKDCIRPDHLELGTHADNMRDKVQRGRSNKAERSYQRRHPEWVVRGSTHGLAKLTEALVLEIRQRYAVGSTSYRELAAMFGVDRTNIGCIVRGVTWPHVAGADKSVQFNHIRRGEGHPSSKLSDAQIADVRRRIAAGERQVDLAREWGVSPATICRWKKLLARVPACQTPQTSPNGAVGG